MQALRSGGIASRRGGPAADLLTSYPVACGAVAALLGCDAGWQPVAGETTHGEASALLVRHPAADEAVTALIS